MKHSVTLMTSVALLLALPSPTSAQDLASSIVGVWKQTSLIRKDVATGQTAPFYGEHQGGYRYFTRGGHTIVFNVYAPRKAPAAPEPTDVERAELFKSASTFSGTYRVEGNKLIMRIDASWIESWTGTERVNLIQISGNKLTLTSPPFKNVLDGKEIVTISTLERAE